MAADLTGFRPCHSESPAGRVSNLSRLCSSPSGLPHLGRLRSVIVVFGSINVDLVVPVKGLPQPRDGPWPGYRVVPGGKGANRRWLRAVRR
jgi:hypothetical protein